jgi:GT2 family glycosyltransferase
VDDGSIDGSREIVSDIAKNANISIRLIQAAHKGASAARNRGMAASAGDYVQFLDADDLMSPRKIELQLAQRDRDQGTVLCGPWLWLRHSNGTSVVESSMKQMNCTDDFIHQWCEGKFFAVHCLLWPRKVLANLGGWDETLAAWQDSDLYIQAVLKGVPFRFVPESVVYYRTGHSDSSVSSGRTLEALSSRIRVLDKVQTTLAEGNKLETYREVLSQTYYALARAFALEQPDQAGKCFDRFLQLSPSGRVPGTLLNHLATRLLGVAKKAKLSQKLHFPSGPFRLASRGGGN